MSEVIGLLFAILIATVMIPKLSSYNQQANDNTRIAATAEQHKVFIDASSQYIKQYSTNIQATATATTPATVTVPMLQSVKLLGSAFTATNPYGQTWQTQVLQPSAGNLQALVMSTGGTVMNDKSASKIAGLVGQAGGLIPKNDSGIYPGGAANAYGSFSGWKLSTTNYTAASAGHLAALLNFNNGQLASNYLYRNAVPGQPQLNRMGTDLDLSNNNLNSVGTINTNLANAVNVKSTKIDTNTLDATGAITSDSRITAKEYLQVKGTVVEGSACPSNDLLARDSNGLILSCQSGVWSTGAKPSLQRIVFNRNTTWIVPRNVKSALVSIAGGGRGGSANYDGNGPVILSSGASGGFLVSYPVNLIPEERISIIIGNGGSPSFSNLRSGTPGGTSRFGNYLICTGGGNLNQENWQDVGNCGDKDGIGNPGVYMVTDGGGVSGGQTPIGYGSGGLTWRCNGCASPNPTIGQNGKDGVVIVDLLI